MEENQIRCIGCPECGCFGCLPEGQPCFRENTNVMKQQLSDTAAFRLMQQREDRKEKLKRLIADMKRRHTLNALIQPFQDEYEQLKNYDSRRKNTSI